jgi:hypothetical protein
MEYYIDSTLSHGSLLTQQSGNNECFETRQPRIRVFVIMKSGFDEGHVTAQNTDRVILARSV